MAKLYDRDNNEFSHIGVPFNYTRGNPLPLDNTGVWTSKAKAEEYAVSSPVAYVGQILSVVENGKVSLWKIANEAGRLEKFDDVGQNAYDNIKRIRKYLYQVTYSRPNYAKAFEYFSPGYIRNSPPSGCSGVRKGNFVGRNFDWTYDHGATFVVRTPADTDRHAVIGIASGVKQLNDVFAATHAYSELFEVLPFMLVDGINDAGLVVETNMVPQGDAGTTTGTLDGAPINLCTVMVPRYLLDHFGTAQAAVNFLQTANIYCPSWADGTMKLEVHFMIADANKTFIVETINNTLKIIDVTNDHPWMTNYYRFGVTMEEDGSFDLSKITSYGLTSHADGIERNNIIAANYDRLSNAVDMMQLMNDKLRYTRAYSRSESVLWYTEFMGNYGEESEWGDMTIDRLLSDHDTVDRLHQKVCEQIFPARSRDTGTTWQTMHTSVYDIASRKLWLSVQESGLGSSFTFKFDEKELLHDHAHEFTSVWTINSTNTALDGTKLSSTRLDNGKIGWETEDGKTYMYSADGAWNIVTPEGVTRVEGFHEANMLAVENFPTFGDVSVFFRHEGDEVANAIVTRREADELFKRLGDVFYRPAKAGVFEEDVEYYIKRDRRFLLAVAGVDYQIGATIPTGRYFSKITEKSVTEQLDEAIDETNYTITISGKTLSLYSRTQIDSAIAAEKARAMAAEKALSDRLDADEARLATRVTAYSSQNETLSISMGEPPPES